MDYMRDTSEPFKATTEEVTKIFSDVLTGKIDKSKT